MYEGRFFIPYKRLWLAKYKRKWVRFHVIFNFWLVLKQETEYPTNAEGTGEQMGSNLYIKAGRTTCPTTVSKQEHCHKCIEAKMVPVLITIHVCDPTITIYFPLPWRFVVERTQHVGEKILCWMSCTNWYCVECPIEIAENKTLRLQGSVLTRILPLLHLHSNWWNTL